MQVKRFLRNTSLSIISLLPSLCVASQTGANAWELVLSRFSESLTGPVAYAISIMVIFASGIAIAFADLQGGAKNFVQAACGISVAIFSSQILTGFLGFSGAVV